ncbi:uracil-DNA glycosylase family protein [Marinigracilibium pacificum]|uniref:DUF4918 family protein n=1 Tax=Marinigracilibium pacificum TaxID=2729599 RepID=A0A848J3B3_9BACT|nr:uracil-DNA glycosylase family protein [Marinigracilibium pacificum]NMM49995.1 DUF4918 family protein [Marinigracilibium pacificum]
MLSRDLFVYHSQLQENFPAENIPAHIKVLYPYESQQTLENIKLFFEKYYKDERNRTIILGINPGRFGAGVTGIPFTDPVFMDSILGISNNYNKKHELSSQFIYKMIDAYGGPELYYNDVIVSAVSPLGFEQDGKNLNYYDDKGLKNKIYDYAVYQLRKLINIVGPQKQIISLGGGKNQDYLEKLNEKEKLVDKIVALPHPRYIMQYKRKSLEDHIDNYVSTIRSVVDINRKI